MSTPQTKQSSAPAADNEVELQSQPMDLAHKSNPVLTGSATALPTRVIGETAKPIFLQVKPSGSPVPIIGGSGVSLSTSSGPSPAGSAIIQNAPAVVPVPIPMAKFQAIRPGTTVTLAPRVVPTALVTTSGAYASLPSHVPKGPAAVASIAIPRSAVATAAVIRPIPSASPTVPQVTGFSVSNRAVRPASVSVRPSSVEVATGATGTLSGTWVTVTPAVTAVVQPPPVPTLYKATTNPVANTSVKNTTNLILAAGHKSAPALTPAPSANSISIIGPPRASTPSTPSNITLFSVRGASSQPVATTRAPTSTIAVGPRPGPEIIKSTSTIIQAASQRTPSMTITSTSSAQATEKQFVKTAPGSGSSANSAGINNPGASQARPVASVTGPVPIVARTVPQVTAMPLTSASTIITANSGVTPVVFTGGLKNITPLSNVTTVGKVGQQGIALQLPQISVPAIGAKSGGSSQPSVVAGVRPAAASSTPAGGGVSGNSRTYLVTTQAPPSSIIPVAKVLPQPAVSTAAGNSAFRSVMAPSNIPGTSSSNENLAGSGSASASASSGMYLHATSRTTTATTESGSNNQGFPVTTQSNTPSKLIGTSPRPSILRKRDYEGVPLKAQKNLSSTLALMTSATSTPTTSSTTATAAAASAISPPSPRRLDLGLTPGGHNGDSSRSSSGGSTTLSASSSPGIPGDLDESNPTSITNAPASAILGKALSSIQIKQEIMDSNETSATAAMLKMSTSAPLSVNPIGSEVQMSPRKKPRKQQLLGQELQEVRSSDDELPPVVNLKEPKVEVVVKVEPKEAPAVVKKPRVSLISTYRQSWKPRNQHFTRYSDVKLKDERRPTVTDLANQKHIMQKVHGWKVFHLTAQIEEMAECEAQVHERLSAVLEVMEKLGTDKSGDRDMMRVNELIKGNLQRSKVIQDGLEDSKTQVQKIFEHKPRAEEIIQRYMYKRLAKKREKI